MLSINVCSLMSKHAELLSFITMLKTHKCNVLLIAIQETWEIPYSDLLKLPGFNLVFKNRTTSNGGGVAFYIKHDVKYKILNNLSPFSERVFECLTIELVINKKKTIASNIYKSPNPLNGPASEHNDLFINYLDTHLYNLAQCNCDTYVFLDSNINLLSINHNVTAAQYLETIYSNGFAQKIGRATRISGSSFSLIDQILCKSSIPNIKSGTVLTDFSDHFTNFVIIPNTKGKEVNQFRFTRNFSANNIRTFKQSLEIIQWNNVLMSRDTNDAFNAFWDTFYTLFNLHFPLQRVKFNRNIHKINNFMTNGLLISRKYKSELHKKALVSPNLYGNAYKNYRNVYNRLIKASKQQHLDEQFRKYQKNAKKTWEILKETALGKNCNNSFTPVINDNGIEKTNPVDISNSFNSFFAQVGYTIRDSVQNIEKKTETYIPDYNPEKPCFELERINQTWIIDVVKNFDNKSSPDLDGLSLNFIKQIIYYITVPLTHVFNLSFSTGIFPEKLKESRIVPIYKTGDPSLCDNYRPISLVNTLSKILEKIVATKLTNHLQINKLLYEHQYGFQRGLSTEHNLLHVINNISSALNNGNYCIGVFLDLRKAFDVCSHDILLKKLTKFGIKEKEYDWFKSYLCNRRQKVDINGILSTERTINISVLQGTTLGPILFLCYINDIFYATNLSLFLFADDTTCFAEHKDLRSLINFINYELQKISNWLDSNKMAINISKTKYIIFRTKGKPIDENTVRVYFNTNEIGKVEDEQKKFELQRVYNQCPDSNNHEYKLLGVYFDEYLSFDKHINTICAKLARACFIIRRVSHKISVKSLKCLYYALFHPHILYCINIYTCTTAKNLKRITILQKKVIRIINKAKSSDHTDILFKNCGILPFNKLIIQAKLHFMHAICYNYAPPTFNDVFTINQNNEVYNLRTRAMYSTPNCRIELFKRFPLYTFPHCWNNSGDITFQPNKVTFQISLKNILLNDLYDDQRLYLLP